MIRATSGMHVVNLAQSPTLTVYVQITNMF
jgi:hypothetical protein